MKVVSLIAVLVFLFSCQESENIEQKKENHDKNPENEISLDEWFFHNDKSDTLQLFIGSNECGEWGGSNRIISLIKGKRNIDVNYQLYGYDCDSIIHLIDEYAPKKTIDSTFTLSKSQETAVIQFMMTMMENQFIQMVVSNGDKRYGVQHGKRFYLYIYGSTEKLYETEQNLLRSFDLEK